MLFVIVKISLNIFLIEISKDLNIKLPPKVKLEQLRDILSNHPAFKMISLLEYILRRPIAPFFRHRVWNN